MTDALLPIIREMHDAETDAKRATVLLQVSDQVLAKYREVFEAACRRAGFELGVEFITVRRACWHAKREADGRLPAHLRDMVERFARHFGGGA